MIIMNLKFDDTSIDFMHYGVKGMKWKNHTYIEKAPAAARTSVSAYNAVSNNVKRNGAEYKKVAKMAVTDPQAAKDYSEKKAVHALIKSNANPLNRIKKFIKNLVTKIRKGIQRIVK